MTAKEVQYVRDQVQISISIKQSILLDDRLIEQMVAMSGYLIDCFRAGHKLLLIGNGGSAADAQHFAAELVGQYCLERAGIPAIALTTDSSVLTALGNDLGNVEVFSRQVETLGNSGDVLLAFSTSGNSPNILRALAAARKKGLTTLALGGRTGGGMLALADCCLCVPSDDTPRIQEAHILIAHILCALVERAMFGLRAE